MPLPVDRLAEVLLAWLRRLVEALETRGSEQWI
jgi:hypothetical protein